MTKEEDYRGRNALADAIDNTIECKLKTLESRILLMLEKLAKRVEVLEGVVQAPIPLQTKYELIKPQTVIGKVGGRKLYREVVDCVKQWGSGRKFKLRELAEVLETKVEGFSKLASTTKKELTRTYLSMLKSLGEAKFCRATGTWELGEGGKKHFEVVEPKIVLMKNKSFAVYKEVVDHIIKWGENKKFTLRELVEELENSVAGWGGLQETTLRSYASVHLRYIKSQNKARNIVGERAWVITKEPSLAPEQYKVETIGKPRRKVLGYVRRNPIHQDVLVKIISKLKDSQNFNSKKVRDIIDSERSETSDETRRCLTYAYLKYLESNKIAVKTEEGYKIINTELIEQDKEPRYETPSLLEDI
ncbi:MAG: hypothetical protein QMD21_06185 [Candidatus Thermoplasmatota archaeon]|nr:hypothetical protein [Candidatus Thermoplasmatota archaeon]